MKNLLFVFLLFTAFVKAYAGEGIAFMLELDKNSADTVNNFKRDIYTGRDSYVEEPPYTKENNTTPHVTSIYIIPSKEFKDEDKVQLMIYVVNNYKPKSETLEATLVVDQQKRTEGFALANGKINSAVPSDSILEKGAGYLNYDEKTQEVLKEERNHFESWLREDENVATLLASKAIKISKFSLAEHYVPHTTIFEFCEGKGTKKMFDELLSLVDNWIEIKTVKIKDIYAHATMENGDKYDVHNL